MFDIKADSQWVEALPFTTLAIGTDATFI